MTLKLGGEFDFLGTADKGDPRFDAAPEPGVVKLYYRGPGTSEADQFGGESQRCGFYKCSRWRFAAFKRASAAWDGFTSWGKYDCIGNYPIARTIVIPDRTMEETSVRQSFFRALTSRKKDRSHE